MGRTPPLRNGLVSAPPCASRRVTRPSGKWGYSARCRMLGHECLVVVLLERALYLLTFSHLLIVNKPSSSSSFLSLSLSLSVWSASKQHAHHTPLPQKPLAACCACSPRCALRLLLQGACCACSSQGIFCLRLQSHHEEQHTENGSSRVKVASITHTAPPCRRNRLLRTALAPPKVYFAPGCQIKTTLNHASNGILWIYILPVVCTLRVSPDQVPSSKQAEHKHTLTGLTGSRARK